MTLPFKRLVAWAMLSAMSACRMSPPPPVPTPVPASPTTPVPAPVPALTPGGVKVVVSTAAAFRTAVAAAVAGETITLDPKTDWTKQGTIYIKGISGPGATIDATQVVAPVPLLAVSHSSGFTVTGKFGGPTTWFGIQDTASDHMHYSHITCPNGTKHGACITFSGSSYTTVDGLDYTDTDGKGINIGYASHDITMTNLVCVGLPYIAKPTDTHPDCVHGDDSVAPSYNLIVNGFTVTGYTMGINYYAKTPTSGASILIENGTCNTNQNCAAITLARGSIVNVRATTMPCARWRTNVYVTGPWATMRNSTAGARPTCPTPARPRHPPSRQEGSHEGRPENFG